MSDESYIQLAIEIAKKGMGNVSPNPLVGCIIIKNDKIIGVGYHEKYGKNHAEINAIESSHESVEGSTLYVNLEPCSHSGNTPPCVDKIIEKKIKRVVIGTLDVNPLVSGRGIKKLKTSGIDVKVGVLEKQCTELNKFFFKYITKKNPYVTLKAAQTLDGKIADVNGNSRWISSSMSRKIVHQMRSKYDAVLVGSGSVEKDDPRLTVRLTEGRNPKRIILDTHLKLNTGYKIFQNNADKKLIVITSEKSIKKTAKLNELKSLGVQILFAKENKKKLIDLHSALEEIGRINIASILVEGGGKLLSSFIKENLFDDISIFIAPKILGGGVDIFSNLGIKNIHNAFQINIDNVEKVGDDVLIELSK